MSTDFILKSFHSCGIFVNVDGSEDVEIYCHKDGEVAALAALAIIDFTCELLQEDEGDKEDPFASVDEEDEGELEHNQLVIYMYTDNDKNYIFSTTAMLC